MVEITVGIPAYIKNNINREFLRQAIESVKNQSYRDFEIIVVDDASTVDIKDLCMGENIFYFRNEKNEGIGFTRNKICELAKGKWVTFCSADDLLPDYALKKHMEAAEKNPDAAQYSDYVNIDDYGRQISVFNAPYHEDRQQLILEVYAWMQRNDQFINFSTLFAKRKHFEILPIQPLRMSEDFLWVAQACKQFDFIHIDKPLCFYRRHAGQATSLRGMDDIINVAQQIKERIFNEVFSEKKQW